MALLIEGLILIIVGFGAETLRRRLAAVPVARRVPGPGLMDTWQAIDSIRVVRKFQERPLEDAHLRRILERRPAGGQLQEQPALGLHRGARAGPPAGAGAGRAVRRTPRRGHRWRSPCVTPDPAHADAPLSVMWDLGRAAQNMVLAAWELGIGSVPATVYDQALARRLLGYPDDQWCEFLISFGYPADPGA